MIVACPTPAMGGEYRDASGFSFTYPDGWIALTNPGKKINQQALGPEIQGWLDKNNINWDKVPVVLIRETSNEVPETLIVTVSRGEFTTDELAVKRTLDSLKQQAKSLGVTIENVDGRSRKYGTNDTIVVDYRNISPLTPIVSHQRTVFFCGDGNTYMLTCTAKEELFVDLSGTFDGILASVKVPAPIKHEPQTASATDFDFGPAFAWTVGVLLVAGVWWGGKRLLARKNGRVP